MKYVKAKVVTVHTIKAHRRTRAIDQLILNLSTRWRWAVNFTHQPLYPQEINLVPTEKEVEWSPELVYMFGRREKYLDVSINLCQSSQQSIIMNRDVFEFLYSCSWLPDISLHLLNMKISATTTTCMCTCAHTHTHKHTHVPNCFL